MREILREIIEKMFKIEVDLEVFNQNSYIYAAILSSSSIVIKLSENKYVISLFPCDLKEIQTLKIRIKSTLDSILKKLKLERPEYYSMIAFTIDNPSYNNHILGVGGKVVGYSGIVIKGLFKYYAYNLIVDRKYLLSENLERFLENLMKIFDNPRYIAKKFGDGMGYSLVAISGYDIITIHTWPESRNLHLEFITEDDSIDLDELFEDYRIVSEHIIESPFYSMPLSDLLIPMQNIKIHLRKKAIRRILSSKQSINL